MSGSLNTRFVSNDDIRSLFSSAMSAMYQAEVPLYGDLLALVAEVNQATLIKQPDLAEQLTHHNELARLNVERHGAIRVGTAAELAMLRRLFAVMGMQAVGYYDLSVAGVPVHSTAFRPIEPYALARNPFRIFTSLLRLSLIADVSLRAQAADILAKRDIFAPRVRTLIATFEEQGGLTLTQAEEFVAEALHTFRWHSTATVDGATYQALHQAHPLIADVVCFHGPHINHLTPRTLDIDAAQWRMLQAGMDPKQVIEGPPQRQCPILLRQTSFKALAEPLRFAGGQTGSHRARFGEIEQRGAALTAKGRALYDALLAKHLNKQLANARQGTEAVNNDDHQRQLTVVFGAFPDTLLQLHEQGLAYFHYQLTTAGAAARGQFTPDTLPDAHTLVSTGLLSITPITYEDFLPVSAAGIFQYNLGIKPPTDAGSQQATGAESKCQVLPKPSSSQAEFEQALGAAVMDSMSLYGQQQRQSYAQAIQALLGG